ncbi:MAG: ComEC/Rec2 family competence protein, partial [Fimbriimonadales bacterium]|nr:ComEC/Rec2 family competence protein [Fimbriimonadales bacterium]
AVVPGDRLVGQGVVDPLSEAESELWRRRGVVGRWKPHRPLQWVQSGPAAARAALQFRERFLAFSHRMLGPGLAQAVDALCFNVRGDLSKEFQRDLRTTGTVHIVSASGLHAAVVAFAVFGLCCLLPIPRWLQLVLAAAMLALYAVAAGLQAPIVRSVALVAGLQSSYLWRREPDAASLTSFTALLFLMGEPWLAWDIGFQLSFATVLGLAAFAGGRPGGGSGADFVRRAACSLLRASVVASAVSAPLVAYHFGQVPLLSVASNLLIAFAVGPVVVLSLAAALLDPWLPAVSQAMALGAVAPLAEWLVGTIDWLGGWEATAPRLPEFGAGWLAAVYGSALLLWRERRRECDSSITE